MTDATANDRNQLQALGAVRSGALRIELETPTSKSWGEPFDKWVRTLISFDPSVESRADLLARWADPATPWNNKLYLQLDQADVQGTLRTPFMSKIKGLLKVTHKNSKNTVFDFYEPDTRRWDILQLADSRLRLGQSGTHRWNDSWQKYVTY